MILNDDFFIDHSPENSQLRSNDIQEWDVLMLAKKMENSVLCRHIYWIKSHLGTGRQYGVTESGAENTKKYESDMKKRRGWLLIMNFSCFRILPWAFIIISEFSTLIQCIHKILSFPRRRLWYIMSVQVRNEI